MTPQDILKIFTTTFHDVAGPRKTLSPYTTIEEIGLDSLDAVDLITSFEKKLKMSLRNAAEQIGPGSTLYRVFRVLIDTLVAEKKITSYDANTALQQYMNNNSISIPGYPTKQMVSIPESLLNECIHALASNKPLISKLKRYQK